VILSLARVEGRKLLRHPVFLAGIALSVIVVFLAGNSEFRGTHSVVEPLWPTGFPIGPLAVFGFVATNLAAMRDRLHGTEELFGSTAAPRRVRTAALLGSAAWATIAGIVLLAPFVGVFAVAHGVSRPDVIKLLEEPLIVAILALAGVALGRLLPTRLAAPIAAFFTFVLVAGYAHPTLPWQFLALWVIPDSLPSVGWHMLYLVGIGIFVATLRQHRCPPAGEQIDGGTADPTGSGGGAPGSYQPLVEQRPEAVLTASRAWKEECLDLVPVQISV